MVGCVIWWPLTNVSASAWSGVTVQTPSNSEIKQCLGWIDGPNNCSWLVFADPTYVLKSIKSKNESVKYQSIIEKWSTTQIKF